MGKGFKKFNKSNTSGSNNDQGTGGTTNSNNQAKGSSGSKLLYLFAPMTTDKSTRYATYDRIKEVIENAVPLEFEYGGDLAEAISEMKDVDFKADTPTLEVSDNLDPKVEERENKAFEKI